MKTKGAKSDGDLYQAARSSRLAELKKLIHEIMAKGKGDDPKAMAPVTAKLEEEEPELDLEPKRVMSDEMREYFKPKPKASRPGTAAFVAGLAKPPAKKPAFGKGKMA